MINQKSDSTTKVTQQLLVAKWGLSRARYCMIIDCYLEKKRGRIQNVFLQNINCKSLAPTSHLSPFPSVTKIWQLLNLILQFSPQKINNRPVTGMLWNKRPTQKLLLYPGLLWSPRRDNFTIKWWSVNPHKTVWLEIFYKNLHKKLHLLIHLSYSYFSTSNWIKLLSNLSTFFSNSNRVTMGSRNAGWFLKVWTISSWPNRGQHSLHFVIMVTNSF
jgi:hypothetical protein